jgi:hypothetical protein
MNEFLVTTYSRRVYKHRKQERQVIIVDGSVRNYVLHARDLVFDHHKPGGADIQLDEIPLSEFAEGKHQHPERTFVTTKVDADACVAAASIILASEGHYPFSSSIKERLEAIAWDCDHLYVPQHLSQWETFAKNAVAALKVQSERLKENLNIPRCRKDWSWEDKEVYNTCAFREGTLLLVKAAKGECPFPGEKGEADAYWESCKGITKKVEKRISSYKDVPVVNLSGFGDTYVDRRCILEAIQQKSMTKTPVVLIMKEIWSNQIMQGYSYTLGVIPSHPESRKLDYTVKTYSDLTNAEPGGIGCWNGRRTVGGSPFENNSTLTPEQVVDIVLGSF